MLSDHKMIIQIMDSILDLLPEDDTSWDAKDFDNINFLGEVLDVLNSGEGAFLQSDSEEVSLNKEIIKQLRQIGRSTNS